MLFRSPAVDVIRRLLDAPRQTAPRPESLVLNSELGRPALSVQSVNRQGVTIRLHAGSGATTAELVEALKIALTQLEADGRGLQR